MARLTKGLVKDTGPADQPKDTWRFAKNIIVNKVNGAISNEGGNESLTRIGRKRYSGFAAVEGYTVIGAIEITDDRIVLFSINNYSYEDPNTGDTIQSEDFGRSEIGVLKGTGYKTVLNLDLESSVDTSLKFSPLFPISGTYKINAEGNLIIYFTDGVNPPRCLNVTRQLNYDSVGDFYPNEMLYGVIPNLSPSKNYIDRLNMFPHSGPVPNINFKSTNSGGALTTGAYQLAIAYVDEDLVPTNYITIDNPVSVVDDLENVLPIERYDGAPPGSATGKSLTWTLTNLNTDYEYIRPAIIQTVGNARFAYRLNDLQIQDTSKDITFTGAEGYVQASVEEIVVDYVQYDTVETLEQVDDVLYAGNLSGSLDVGFQKFAGNITLQPRIRVLQNFEPVDVSTDALSNGYLDSLPPNTSKKSSYRDIELAYKFRGFMRDEVYAFYIAFILNDGRMSYAYHIPGRKIVSDELQDGKLSQELKDISTNSKNFHFVDYSDEDGANNMNYWENSNETYPDTEDYNNSAFKNSDGSMAKVRHHHFPSNRNDAFAFWQGGQDNWNTVEADPVTITWEVSGGSQNIEVHTNNLEDHDWGDVNIPTQSTLPTSSSQNLTAFYIADISEAVPTIGTIYTIEVNWDGNWITTDDYDSTGECLAQDGNWFLFNVVTGDAPGYLQSEGRFEGAKITGIYVADDQLEGNVTGNVSVLGFQLDNIKIPASISKKVQGFRIYYAKRKHEHKTILGQGIPTPTVRLETQLGGCLGEVGAGNDNPEEVFASFPIYTTSSLLTDNDEVAYDTLSFYNFELLRTKNSIAAATHLTSVGKIDYLTWKGAGENHTQPDDTVICADDTNIRSTFALLENIHLSPQVFKDGVLAQELHTPLKERCKTYIRGNSIYDGRGLGFGLKIYNRGGESRIGLSTVRNLSPIMFATDYNTPIENWTPSGAPMNFIQNTKLATHTVNLSAFKEDVYNAIDTQDLIWTGFQVEGEKLNNFIEGESWNDEPATFSTIDVGPTIDAADANVPDDSNPDGVFGATYKYYPIFGGDTFICRYGFRQTLSPRLTAAYSISRASIIYTIIESSDNICLRHEEGNPSTFFPGSPVNKVMFLDRAGLSDEQDFYLDLTAQENIKYNEDYSLVNEIATAFPLPLLTDQPRNFPTRIHRSIKSDPGSLIDNFRHFLALNYKDLPKNRGSITELSSFNNLLYIHTKDSLFRTKGKQSMQLSDGSQAFVGSGDIFAQEPDELISTDSGHGGTNSQASCLVTKYGYFSVDASNNRIFLTTNTMNNISALGMDSWFQDNMAFNYLGEYGYLNSFFNLDSPIIGLGYTAVWDYKNERVLLTKRDLKPRKSFERRFNAGRPVNDPEYAPLNEAFNFDIENVPIKGMSDILLNTDAGVFTTPSASQSPFTDTNNAVITYTGEKTFTITSPLKTSVSFGINLSSNDYKNASEIDVIVGLKLSGGSNLLTRIDTLKGTLLNSQNFNGSGNFEYKVDSIISKDSVNDDLVMFFTFQNIGSSETITVEFTKFSVLAKITEDLFSINGVENGSIVFNPDQNNFTLRSVKEIENILTTPNFKVTDNVTGDVTNITQAESTQGDWVTGAGWVIEDGSASTTGAHTNSLEQPIQLTDDATSFRFSLDCVEYTSGSLNVRIGTGYPVEITSEELRTNSVSVEVIHSGRSETPNIYIESKSFVGAITNLNLKFISAHTDVRRDGLESFINTYFEIGETSIEVTEDESIENAKLFERAGWTISFYPKEKFWGSFHDYIPSLYSYDSSTILSFDNLVPDESEEIYGENIFSGSIENITNLSNSSATYVNNILTYIYNDTDNAAHKIALESPYLIADTSSNTKYRISGNINSISYEASETGYNSNLFKLSSALGTLKTFAEDETGSFEIITNNAADQLIIQNSVNNLPYASGFTVKISNIQIRPFESFENSTLAYNVWRHDDFTNPGNFYGKIYPFQVEVIDNRERQTVKLSSSFGYETDSILNNNRQFNNGFTSFIAFNNSQSTGETPIKYFKDLGEGSSVRKVGNEWRINEFRDLAVLQSILNETSSTLTHVQESPMFYVDGMNEVANTFYTNAAKPWHQQKKFIDTFLGIRLIGDNLNKNLVTLYSTSVAMRKYNR